MSHAFPHLFSPLKLNHKTLKHRLNFGAHTANMSEGGLPVDRHLGYYLERSLGGAAMIVVEPVPVHRTAVLTRGNFRQGDDAVIPYFRRITDACHENGTVMIQQMYHVGAHGDWDNSLAENWSPSGLVSWHDSDGSHKMNEREIAEIVDGFGKAAWRAKEAGFDGVELMAAYNALIEQFWTPYNNRRDDSYGGSFEKRMRFSTEVLQSIRKYCGPDFIIGMAVSVDPNRSDVMSVEDQAEIARYHDERGLYDYITCGTGSYFEHTAIIPSVFYADKLGPPHAEVLKRAVKHVKVQAESHIRTPENAENVISSGQADMVSIVRGQIADPHLANKAKDGRADDIRPCISCNQMCWGRRSRDYHISCLINPSAGREFMWGGDRFKPAEKPKHILVVGGGPAGLEAARVAAERGHRVTLVEASDKLGGAFRLAGLQPRRAQILDLIQWYERQLEKLQVRVELNKPVEASDLAAYGADQVVLATGSLPAMTGFQRALPHQEILPGADKPNVFSAEDVMGRAAKIGQRVLILDEGGNWKGVGTAWHLAEAGHQVSIVTSAAVIGFEMMRTNADGLARVRLAKKGVKFFVESVLLAWHGDGATIQSLLDGSEQRLSFDTLVLSCTNEPNSALAEEVSGASAIGDGLAPRHAAAAIYEGRKLGLTL